MSEPNPSNSLSLRVKWLEDEVGELKRGQPAVMVERVGMLSTRVGELRAEFVNDLSDLRAEMRERDQARQRQIQTFQRIFVTVFSGVGIAVAVAVIAQFAAGGGP